MPYLVFDEICCFNEIYGGASFFLTGKMASIVLELLIKVKSKTKLFSRTKQIFLISSSIKQNLLKLQLDIRMTYAAQI